MGSKSKPSHAYKTNQLPHLTTIPSIVGVQLLLLQMYLLMNILLATEREHNVSVQRKFTLVEDVLYFIFFTVIYQARHVLGRRYALIYTNYIEIPITWRYARRAFSENASLGSRSIIPIYIK